MFGKANTEKALKLVSAVAGGIVACHRYRSEEITKSLVPAIIINTSPSQRAEKADTGRRHHNDYKKEACRKRGVYQESLQIT